MRHGAAPMSDRLLLDTCAAIWITTESDLASKATAAIDESFQDGQSVSVSLITAWEFGLLVARGRVASTVTPRNWFRALVGEAGLVVADLSAEILIDSSFLPGEPPSDPADRMIIATARAQDMTIVTRDRAILHYADAGHVRALLC